MMPAGSLCCLMTPEHLHMWYSSRFWKNTETTLNWRCLNSQILDQSMEWICLMHLEDAFMHFIHLDLCTFWVVFRFSHITEASVCCLSSLDLHVGVQESICGGIAFRNSLMMSCSQPVLLSIIFWCYIPSLIIWPHPSKHPASGFSSSSAPSCEKPCREEEEGEELLPETDS